MASIPAAVEAKAPAPSRIEPIWSVANTLPAAVPFSARMMRRNSSVGGVTPENA